LEFALLGIHLKARFCRLKLVFAVLTVFAEKPVAPFGFVENVLQNIARRCVRLREQFFEKLDAARGNGCIRLII